MSKKKGPGFFDKMKSLFKKGDKGSVPPPDESFEEEQQETLLESITDEDDLHQHLDFDHDDDELDEDFVVTEMRATPPPAPTLDNDKTDSNILSFEQQDKTQSDVDAPDDMPDIPETPPSTPVDKTGPINFDPSKLDYVNDLEEDDLLHDDDEELPSFEQMRVELPNAPSIDTESGFKSKMAAVGGKLQALVAQTFQKIKRVGKKSSDKTNAVTATPRSTVLPTDWDSLVEKVFDPKTRKSIHQGFVTASLVVGTYSTGKISAYLLKGQEKRPKRASMAALYEGKKGDSLDMSAVKLANLFNVKREPTDQKTVLGATQSVDLKKNCTEASKASGLPIKLVNTTVLQDSIKSIASVSVRGGTGLMDFREGEKVEGMAQVGRVGRLRVILKNLATGECEFIENLDEKMSRMKPITIVDPATGKKLMSEALPDGIKNEGNKFIIKKSFRDKMLEDVGSILTQARAVQMTNADGTMNFKMTEIVPGSIYSHLNIQEGDIISKINGKEISNLNDIMSMFGRIKDVDHLSITVGRGGNETELEYEFE